MKWHKKETFSMEKMEKPLSNSPFMLFYAINFDHRITYVAAYLDTVTCLFSHTRLLKAHTKLLDAHTRLLEAHICNSNSTQLGGRKLNLINLNFGKIVFQN